MDFAELIKQAVTGLENIPEAGKLAETVLSKAKEAGIAILINPNDKPEYIPKSRFDEVNTHKNTLEEQVKAFPKQIEELTKKAGDAEAFKAEAETLKGTLKESETNYQNTLKQTRVEAAIKLAAMGAKANDPADVMKFIDTSKITVDGDTVKGVETQLEELQKSKAYLFSPPESRGGGDGFGGGTNNNDIDVKIAEAIKSGNYAESVRLKGIKFNTQT